MGKGVFWAGESGPQDLRSGDLEIEGVGSGSGVGKEAKEAVGIAVIAFDPVGEEALPPGTVALLLVEEDGQGAEQGQGAGGLGMAHPTVVLPQGMIAAVVLAVSQLGGGSSGGGSGELTAPGGVPAVQSGLTVGSGDQYASGERAPAPLPATGSNSNASLIPGVAPKSSFPIS